MSLSTTVIHWMHPDKTRTKATHFSGTTQCSILARLEADASACSSWDGNAGSVETGELPPLPWRLMPTVGAWATGSGDGPSKAEAEAAVADRPAADADGADADTDAVSACDAAAAEAAEATALEPDP